MTPSGEMRNQHNEPRVSNLSPADSLSPFQCHDLVLTVEEVSERADGGFNSKCMCVCPGHQVHGWCSEVYGCHTEEYEPGKGKLFTWGIHLCFL